MKTIEGLILKKIDYEDYDEIVTVFSKEYGLINLYAPGVRKLTSKNKTALQLFSLANFEIFKSSLNRLSKLKKAYLIESHFNIANSYFNYLLAVITIEISGSFFLPGEKSFEYYQLLKLVLTEFDQNNFPLKTFAIYLYRALKYNNSSWDLQRCLSCNKKINHPRFFSIRDYGVFCDEDFALDQEEKNVIENQRFIELLNEIIELPIIDLREIELDIKMAIFLVNILLTYYESVLGISNYAFSEIKKQPFLQ